MSAFGPKVQADGAPALPCWIGGHAYLTMAPMFVDVLGPDGQALRRVPLCGEEPVVAAVQAAAAALPLWRAMSDEARQACFAELQALLGRYRGHLAKLVGEESGLAEGPADAELQQTLDVLGAPLSAGAGRAGIAAVIGDFESPFAGPARVVIEALAAGWAIIVKPSPKAPSALFALGEVFTRAGFPNGLVNVVHGDEEAVRALCRNGQVNAIAFVGGERVGAKVQAIAAEHGRPFVGGPAGDKLVAAWRRCLDSDA